MVGRRHIGGASPDQKAGHDVTPSLAAATVRGWVALYTWGLAPAVRSSRRAEIEGDLWAHAEDAYVAGHAPVALDLEMFARLVMGMPADMAWRWSHRGIDAPIEKEEIVMHEPRSHQVLAAIGIGLAVLGLAFAVLNLVVIQQNGSDRPSDVLAASAGAVVIFIGMALALTALLIVSRNPTTGRQLAIVGGAVIGLTVLMVFAWAWPVGIVMGLPAVIGVVRSRQVLEAQGNRAV